MTMTQFTNQTYVNLETFKKDGTGVKTPLWFIEQEGALYMRTPMHSWKVKRIRRQPHVRLVPSDARGRAQGEWVTGQATITPEAEMAWVNDRFKQKYKLLKWLIDLGNKLSGRQGTFAVITVHVQSSS